ncbi:hypothetical protein, partial [Planifilum fimeticola]
ALLLWKRNNGPQGGSFIRLFFSIFFQLAYKPSGFSAGFVNSLTPPFKGGSFFTAKTPYSTDFTIDESFPGRSFSTPR